MKTESEALAVHLAALQRLQSRAIDRGLELLAVGRTPTDPLEHECLAYALAAQGLVAARQAHTTARLYRAERIDVPRGSWRVSRRLDPSAAWEVLGVCDNTDSVAFVILGAELPKSDPSIVGRFARAHRVELLDDACEFTAARIREWFASQPQTARVG